jgi:hypothetical protein
MMSFIKSRIQQGILPSARQTPGDIILIAYDLQPWFSKEQESFSSRKAEIFGSIAIAIAIA